MLLYLPAKKDETITLPPSLNLDYYYGNEMDQYNFYRILKALLIVPYKSAPIETKGLYPAPTSWASGK